MAMPFQPRYVLRNLKTGFRLHGAKFPLVAATRVCQLVQVSLAGDKVFTYQGREYRFFYHLENPTFRCERCVEVALALDAVEGIPPEATLEVGNVLANYGTFRHTVIDKYEKDTGVLNVDIVTFTPERTYQRVLCISTLEHIGWDESPRDPDKILPALDVLKRAVSPGEMLLLTVPIGYNTRLDEAIQDDRLGCADVGFMFRDPDVRRWREADYETVKGVAYGAPYPNANAIMIGRYTPDP